VQLTIDAVRRLELVLEVLAQFWCNLEALYRENLAKVNEEKDILKNDKFTGEKE